YPEVPPRSSRVAYLLSLASRRSLRRRATVRAGSGKLRHRGTVEQLLGVGAADVALRVAAQHARDFRDSIGSGEHGDVSRRHAAASAFGNENVVVRAGGDLR